MRVLSGHCLKVPKSRFLIFLLLAFPGAFALAQSPPSQSDANGLSIASQSSPTGKSDYVVIKPVVNMYRNPNLRSDVVSQAIYGTNITRLRRKWGWAKVRTGDEYTGWIQLSNLRKLKGQVYAAGGPIIRVSQLSANIYLEPDVTKHAPIEKIPWESRLEVLPGKVDEVGRWLKVRLPDGSRAFVQSGDVSTDFHVLTVDQVIAVAKHFIGVTYTWGGSSDFGFDCSGFTQMLMRQRGIVMPRDADLQAAWSGVAPVDFKDLQPGDLLFFGDRLDHITHTGLYIGNGQFIHDTTHDHPGVQISSLDNAPWTRLLIAARRTKS